MAAPVKAIVLVAGLFACSNSESLTGQVMPTAKPVGAPVHVNTAAPELERYTRIVGNVADCSLEGYQVPATCPGMVRYSDSVRGIPSDMKVLVGREMLGNASPAIRVEAAKLVLAAGRTGDALDTVATAAVRE